MKINDKEIADIGSGQAVIEGRLHHKKEGGNLTQTGFKERWFKLRANILYYFNLSDTGKILEKKPAGAFVLEHCIIMYEALGETPFSFSLTFKDEVDKKHIFSGRSEDYINQWITALKEASYEVWRAQLLMLQMQISVRTGQDPLLMYHRGEGSRLPLNTTATSSPKKNHSSFRSYVGRESNQEGDILQDPGLKFIEDHFGNNGLEAIGTGIQNANISRTHSSRSGGGEAGSGIQSSGISRTQSSRGGALGAGIQSANISKTQNRTEALEAVVNEVVPDRKPSPSRRQDPVIGTSVIARPRPVGNLLPPAKPPRASKVGNQVKPKNLIEF